MGPLLDVQRPYQAPGTLASSALPVPSRALMSSDSARRRTQCSGEITDVPHHDRHGQPNHLGEPPERPTCIIRAIAGPVCRGTEGAGCCRLRGMCAESSAVSSLGVVSGVMPQATPALAP